MSISDEQFNKLPKYAQEHIEELQRDRDLAIKKLNDFLDSQTPSPIYVDDMIAFSGGPKQIRQYVHGQRVFFEKDGVTLEVSLFDDYRNIEMRYYQTKRLTGSVALTPVSHQHLRLPVVDS